jgi:hypothetical protein
MKMPKIGEVVYAINDGRIGETRFLCSTQENCSTDLEMATREASTVEVDDGYYPGFLQFPPSRKYKAVHDAEVEANLVVWEMRRIR